jgi:TrpR-related protein YerC/YecD
MAEKLSTKSKHLALLKSILSLENVAEAAKFFEDLCTPKEMQDLSDRWRVVQLLRENIPYRQIQEMTKVSVTTIGRVARAIHFGTGGYDLIYERMKDK